MTLEIGTVPVPEQTVKIKISGKTLGELDSDSIQQLKSFNYLKNDNPLNLKLRSISENGTQAFVLGESPNGNLLKINKINFYDFSTQVFDDKDYRQVTIEMPPTKTRDAVFLNGEPLGVLHFKKDKEALRELGILNVGKLTKVQATLQSNFSTTHVKIDPSTVEYPAVWTKESQAFGTQQSVNQGQQVMIEKAAPILQKIKERPTILFASAEDKMLGITQLAVDNHKVQAVTKWLTAQNVVYSQVPPEDVVPEAKKGLAVFNLVSSSIPSITLESMTKKFGAVIESTTEYQQFVNSLPTRPQFLKPPELPTLPLDEKVLEPRTEPKTLIKPSNSINDRVVKTEFNSVENRPVVTSEHLQNWYNVADKLGKSEQYKQRISEIAADFQSGQQLSQKALAAMNQDTEEHHRLGRLTQIAQKISPVLGESTEDGSIQVKGKIYDIFLNSDRKDLIISQKNGDVVLGVQSGKVQTNKVSPQVIQTFEQANRKIDQALLKAKEEGMQL